MEAIGLLGADAVGDEALGLERRAGSDPIRHWALANRDALRGDAALLAELGLRLEPGNVIEFWPAALSRAAAERDRELLERQRLQMIAQANFAAQAQTHAAAIDLIESGDLEDLARRLDELARLRFALAAGVLAIEGPGAAPRGWRALVQGQIDLLLGGGRPSLMGHAPTAQGLFCGAPSVIESTALVRLSLWGRVGLLALGAPDPDAFSVEMGGELVTFLGRVVERTAERWRTP